MDWIVWLSADSPPPYLYVEVLIPTVIVFGESVLGRWLRLSEVIRVDPNPLGSVFSKEEGQTIQLSLCCRRREAIWGHREEVADCKPARETSPDQICQQLDHEFLNVDCLSHPSIIFCYGSPTKWIQCVSGLILTAFHILTSQLPCIINTIIIPTL